MTYVHTPQRPASQGHRTRDDRFSAYNVVAEFPDLASARGAISALSRGRIEADTISMFGPAAEQAAGEIETAKADTQIARYLTSRVGTGAIAGSVAGAAVGLIIGAVAGGAFGVDVSPGVLLAVMLFGAVGFGAIGGFLAGMSSLQMAEPWELTFHDARGQAFVGVHSENPEDIDRAETILEQENPLEMYRVRPDGMPV